MVTVSDGKVRPQPMRLYLSMELLRLQKEELSPLNHNYNRKPSPADSRVSALESLHHIIIIKRKEKLEMWFKEKVCTFRHCLTIKIICRAQTLNCSLYISTVSGV